MSRRLVGLAVLGLLAGCSYDGASSLPLPGAIGGDDTYEVTVHFADATNLVPKETCRANDTVIGSVVSVEVDDQLRAEVVCAIKDDVELPANVVAALRETSLLGERFVALDPPVGQAPRGTLEPGSQIPETSTRVDPNVEMVLGALSQLLNGGSLGSIQTISDELSNALSVTDFGVAAHDIDALVGNFADHREELTASLEALDRLAGGIAKQRGALAAALDSIPGGLEVLDASRPKLVATLRKLADLSRVAVPLIARSRASTVADLEHLEPVLRELAKSGDDLALALERIASIPFPSNAMATIKGDWAGMYAQLTLDADSLNEMLRSGGAPIPPPGRTDTPTTSGLPSLPGLPTLPGLPALPGLDGLHLPLLGSDTDATVGGDTSTDGPQSLADLLLGGAR